MSGTVWTKFFWSDWDTDPALRLCSYSAQGLWMRMLCIAAAHDPIGYVAVAGRALDETSIARMTGGLESEVRDLLGELDRNGVFSRDRQGRIYSRRMVSDTKRAAIARKNGKKGGNPSLRNDEGNSPSDNPQDNAPLKTHKPEANIQKTPRAPKGAMSELVEQVWSALPPKSRGRTSRPDIETALRAASDRGGDPADAAARLTAYYATPDATKEGGQFAKTAHRLLEKDRWRDLPTAPTPIEQLAAKPDPNAVWRHRVSAYLTGSRYWNTNDWGAQPGRAGCVVPAEILAEFPTLRVTPDEAARITTQAATPEQSARIRTPEGAAA